VTKSFKPCTRQHAKGRESRRRAKSRQGAKRRENEKNIGGAASCLPEPSPEPSVEPDLALHQSLPDFSGTFGTFSGTSLNLTQRLQQCTPELFWAEDPISLRCCRKKHQKDNKTARRPAAPMATTVYQQNPHEAGGGSFQQQAIYTIGVKGKVCL